MNTCRCSAILISTLLFAACNPSKDTDVEYHPTTLEESAEATKSAFSFENKDPLPQNEAIDTFFTELGLATRSSDPIDMKAYLSVDAMLQSLHKGGMLEGLNFLDRKRFDKRFRQQTLSTLSPSLKQMAYDDHRILKIETLDENESIAYVRHYDNELNITLQIRWWMVEGSDGWRFYDYEELSVGLRVINLMGVALKASMAEPPEPWITIFTQITPKLQTLDFTDLDSVLSLEPDLRKLRSLKIPTSIQRFASMMMVSVLMVKGEAESSLAELEAAKKGGYESPIRHYLAGSALMQLERYNEALEAYDQHAALLGWDSDVLEMVADCYYFLGDLPKARQAAIQGLEDNPNSINCLASLVAASSVQQLKNPETLAYFASCSDPEWAYEVSLDYIIDLDQIPKAKALFSQFKTTHPKSELHEYYENLFLEIGTSEPVIERN